MICYSLYAIFVFWLKHRGLPSNASIFWRIFRWGVSTIYIVIYTSGIFFYLQWEFRVIYIKIERALCENVHIDMKLFQL